MSNDIENTDIDKKEIIKRIDGLSNELDATLEMLNDMSDTQGGDDNARCCDNCDMPLSCINMKLDLMLGGLGDMSSDIDGIDIALGEWIPAIDKKLDKILDVLGGDLGKK